ncbi:hypothetical protein GWI33_008470 [Rhynchophorus ferrugineus]|uniref:Uncharacterized protein n=1 Tax=Rhynchophorus ferrugineus TaxID=354439 RepID=A0A834ICY5_RHYFE|nr:hypothetical protein GWI33_008470 [Rhynchophorus ferrugineus]
MERRRFFPDCGETAGIKRGVCGEKLRTNLPPGIRQEELRFDLLQVSERFSNYIRPHADKMDQDGRIIE